MKLSLDPVFPYFVVGTWRLGERRREGESNWSCITICSEREKSSLLESLGSHLRRFDPGAYICQRMFGKYLVFVSFESCRISNISWSAFYPLLMELGGLRHKRVKLDYSDDSATRLVSTQKHCNALCQATVFPVLLNVFFWNISNSNAKFHNQRLF